MRGTEKKTQQVGVRELRQNLSRYLRLVADLTELGLPPEEPGEMSISEALAAQREER